jgi:hypothetical protein
MTYRKIGGIHWLAFGRLRIAVCRTRKRERLEWRYWMGHQWAVLALGVGFYGLIVWSVFG